MENRSQPEHKACWGREAGGLSQVREASVQSRPPSGQRQVSSACPEQAYMSGHRRLEWGATSLLRNAGLSARKFLVHGLLKPLLENLERYFASM